jgi:hypothetical protein
MTTAAKWQRIRNVIVNKSARNNKQNIGAIAMERIDERLGGMLGLGLHYTVFKTCTERRKRGMVIQLHDWTQFISHTYLTSKISIAQLSLHQQPISASYSDQGPFRQHFLFLPKVLSRTNPVGLLRVVSIIDCFVS